jgi:hypothetical protein
MGLPEAQFRSNFYDLAPPWLRTGVAEKYLYTLGLCTDILLDKMDQAARIRMPGQGDATQIPWLAHDRQLVQGPKETSAAFIVRLQQAFPTWKTAGSRIAIHKNIQPYLQGLQPGVSGVLPEMSIIGGDATWTQWTTTYQGDAIGANPTILRTAENWNWDGLFKPWRAWLVLFMSTVATGLSGAAGQTGATSGPTNGTGTNTGGVWVPNAAATGGVGFVALSGLTGLTPTQVGQWITVAGSSHTANNGTFPIVAVASGNACTIANPSAVANDAGPLTWSIASYPFIGPSLPWGSPGQVWGQGELQIPPLDTGSLVGGIWEPTTAPLFAQGPSFSWGLSCQAAVIQSIRSLLFTWKGGKTYYSDIVVAFDGSTGVAGSAFSPNSAPGSGNADGTFGGRGKSVAGVWVPNRQITSPFNAWCQGTGSWPGGAAEVT